MATARDLVACERRCSGDVQRRNLAVHRDADENVAAFARETRQPAPLGAEHDHDLLVGEIEIGEGRFPAFVEPDCPTSGPLRALTPA